MTLNIISAEKVEFTGEVSKVTMPGALGLFTVLENHAALISSLVAGKMVYTADGKDEEMEIKGGIADINHNVVSVCLY
jgi:F-type H+-transporting ATPase subunit epsilon